MCDQCGRPTRQYARRVATISDEESDRETGEVVWFCHECGHKVQVAPASSLNAEPFAGDDLSELFDRH
jgi:RNase P subunit RPR2